MRLTGGRARGIPLKAPDEGTRPATDQLREAVFSSLAARVSGARVLDLFAGSGSYGLEAWSRGAERVVFIEKNSKALGCLKTNLAAVAKSLGLESGNNVEALGCDALFVRPEHAGCFDLVFADPPYALLPACGAGILGVAASALVDGGVLVLECPSDKEPVSPPGWERARRLGKQGRGEPGVVLWVKKAGSGNPGS